MKLILPLFLALLSVSSIAAETELVSPAQQLRKSFVNDCTGRGIQKQDDALAAAKFCTCVFDVMAHELTLQEYLDIDKASREHQQLSSLPPMVRIKGKLEACKK